MDVILETERLILRRLTPDDVDNLFDLDNDPDVLRYITGGTSTLRETIERRVLPMYLEYSERFPGFGHWAAIEKSTGQFLGWIGLGPAEGRDPDEVELGYRLRKSAWGKGYATEGSRALIRKAFTEQGVRRVFATAYEDNIASRRVMEKCGLRHVRSYRPTPEELAAAGLDPHDVWEGEDVEYALEKVEWERQEATERERRTGAE